MLQNLAVCRLQLELAPVWQSSEGEGLRFSSLGVFVCVCVSVHVLLLALAALAY